MELFENDVYHICVNGWKQFFLASVVFEAYQSVANQNEKDFFSGLRQYFQCFSVFCCFHLLAFQRICIDVNVFVMLSAAIAPYTNKNVLMKMGLTYAQIHMITLRWQTHTNTLTNIHTHREVDTLRAQASHSSHSTAGPESSHAVSLLHSLHVPA